MLSGHMDRAQRPHKTDGGLEGGEGERLHPCLKPAQAARRWPAQALTSLGRCYRLWSLSRTLACRPSPDNITALPCLLRATVEGEVGASSAWRRKGAHQADAATAARSMGVPGEISLLWA